MIITFSKPHIDGLIPVGSLEIRGAQPLPERRCVVYTSLYSQCERQEVHQSEHLLQ